MEQESKFGLAPLLKEGTTVCSFCRFPPAECQCNGRPLQNHNMRPQPLKRNSFAYLVTSSKQIGGLGYCCTWFFLEKFKVKPTLTIAQRLGVTTRTVRRARAEWRDGKGKCKRCTSV